MHICDFAEVAVVPFPFVDLSIAKRRPALCLTNRRFNAQAGQTVFAMITTARRSNWPSDVLITDGAAAGLQHASVIRFKLFTLPNEVILRSIGFLSPDDLNVLQGMVRQHLTPLA